MYFFPEVTARVAAGSSIRACVGLIMLDFPTAYADNPDQYFAKGLALHDEYRHHPLVRNAFAPHAPYTVSDAPLKKVQVLADELDIPVHIHLHETASEVEESRARTGQRPLERLETLGLLSPALTAVHMTQLQDDEIARLAAAGASVVHCPESNLKLASGFCPVQRLLDAGVNVALGTDGAASNNDLDMLGEMRTAALLAKAVYNDAAALPAHAVLRMATLNGARALGMNEETGSLVAGKWADIAAVDLGTLETQPLYDPVSQLVYAATRSQVTDVWVAGQQLLKNRALTQLETQDLIQRAHSWQARIAAGDSGA
jgi:5-methylthioadenosine/S-adenosylhomocysteine deaminase